MALKFDIARSRADVQTAILHFAARRSYRLFNAWWLDGQRMEIPQPDNRRGAEWSDPLLSRFWSGLRRSLDMDQPPRIDIELKRSRSQTIVSMKLGPNAHSVQLASALQTHLSSDAAYAPPCPQPRVRQHATDVGLSGASGCRALSEGEGRVAR